jgi:hypothetical protein
MHDPPVVQILKRQSCLVEKSQSDDEWQTFFRVYEVEHTGIARVLEQQVDCVVNLKGVLEPCNVLVIERSVNLNLSLEILDVFRRQPVDLYLLSRPSLKRTLCCSSCFEPCTL